MRRNSIFLRSKPSDKEVALLKLDQISNVTYFASKIRHLDVSRNVIEEVATNAVEQIFSIYKFGQDVGLGDLVKTAVIADLKAYYKKAYPDQADKVIWPDLDKRAPFDKLLEVLEKIKLLPKGVIGEIFGILNRELQDRQLAILMTVYHDSTVTYAEISKQFGKRGVMTYREIKIIYNQLIQTLKALEINL
jgi:hypothetical protein